MQISQLMMLYTEPNFNQIWWKKISQPNRIRIVCFFAVRYNIKSFSESEHGNSRFCKSLFSTWQVSKRSEHENYLSTNILKTLYMYVGFNIPWTFFLSGRYHCGKFFNQLTDCMEQKTHTGKKSYTCQYCKKSFNYSFVCKQHERTHTGEKPYTCKHCKKSFSHSSAYKEHERTHTGEKPYTCKHCKKSFSQLSNCKQHERTHTGEKPYTCKQCKKSFSHSSHLRQHERSHTREKPYTCRHCKKSFSWLSSCKQHERTHTGEKPYACKHCNKSFSQSSNCKIHEERHARASSFKQKQHDQCSRSRKDLQESAGTVGDKKSCVLSSLTEENSSEVESLTCWICQKEFTSETCVMRHYDEHMRLKWRLHVYVTIISKCKYASFFHYAIKC